MKEVNDMKQGRDANIMNNQMDVDAHVNNEVERSQDDQVDMGAHLNNEIGTSHEFRQKDEELPAEVCDDLILMNEEVLQNENITTQS